MRLLRILLTVMDIPWGLIRGSFHMTHVEFGGDVEFSAYVVRQSTNELGDHGNVSTILDLSISRDCSSCVVSHWYNCAIGHFETGLCSIFLILFVPAFESILCRLR